MTRNRSRSKGIPGKVQRLKSRVLSGGLVKFLIRVFNEFGHDDGPNLAAAVAYYSFLSLFPLMLALIGVLGLFLPSEDVKQQIFSYIESNIPGSTDVLNSNIQSIIDLRSTLGAIGIIGLLWSGSQAVSSLNHAINRAWDVPREIQFYFKKLRDIGLTIGLGIMFMLSLVVGGAFAIGPIRDLPIFGSAFALAATRVIAFLLSFAIFLILFKVVPNTRTFWRHIWFGAFITAVFFEIGRNVMFIYLTNFTRYQLIYGSVASIIVLLAWLYYSSLIIVLGAEVTSEYGRIRRGIGASTHSHSTAKPAEA